MLGLKYVLDRGNLTDYFAGRFILVRIFLIAKNFASKVASLFQVRALAPAFA